METLTLEVFTSGEKLSKFSYYFFIFIFFKKRGGVPDSGESGGMSRKVF